MSAKGTRKPESTNPSQPKNGLIRIRRCSVFGSSKGGRAGGQKNEFGVSKERCNKQVIEMISLQPTILIGG